MSAARPRGAPRIRAPLVCFGAGTDIVVVTRSQIASVHWQEDSAGVGERAELVQQGRGEFDRLQALSGLSPALLACSQRLWRALQAACTTSRNRLDTWRVLEIQLLLGNDTPPRRDFVQWAFGDFETFSEDSDVRLLLMGRGIAAAQHCAKRVKRRGDADFVNSVKAMMQLLEQMPGQTASEPHPSQWLKWRGQVKDFKAAHYELQRPDSDLGRMCRIMEGDVVELMAALELHIPGCGWQHLLACLLLFQAPTAHRHQIAALAGECARWKGDASQSSLAALRGDAALALQLLRLETMDAWVDCHLTEVLLRAGAMSNVVVAGYPTRLLAIGRYALSLGDSIETAEHYLSAVADSAHWILRCVDLSTTQSDSNVRRTVDFCLSEPRLRQAGLALCSRRAQYWKTRALASAVPWAQAAAELPAFESALVESFEGIADVESAVEQLGANLSLLPETSFLRSFGALHRLLLQAAAALEAGDLAWATMRDRAIAEAAEVISIAPRSLVLAIARKALLFGVDRPKRPPTASVESSFKLLRAIEDAGQGSEADDLRVVLLQVLAGGIVGARWAS